METTKHCCISSTYGCANGSCVVWLELGWPLQWCSGGGAGIAMEATYQWQARWRSQIPSWPLRWWYGCPMVTLQDSSPLQACCPQRWYNDCVPPLSPSPPKTIKFQAHLFFLSQPNPGLALREKRKLHTKFSSVSSYHLGDALPNGHKPLK